ncbi:MAG: heparinase II/III family protein, partial [Opitutus sp.]
LAKGTPRLVFTPRLEAQLRDKLKSDPLVRAYYENCLRDTVQKMIKEPPTKFVLNGYRTPAGRLSISRLQAMAMVHRLEPAPAILQAIEAELNAVCYFPNWNPQHFQDVAQISLGVAFALDWVGRDLRPETVKLAKAALIEKCLKPGYDESIDRMDWISGNNHWTPICHAGMVAAALTIAEDDPVLAAKTIARAVDNMNRYLLEFHPHGTPPEGPGYWRYGNGFLALLSDMLTSALGSDFGIAADPGLIESAAVRLQLSAPSGEIFNFADSDGNTDGDTHLLLMWFAGKTGDGLFFNRAFFENPNGGSGRLTGAALLWLAAQTPPEKTSDLPLAWYRNGTSPLAVFRGAKGDPAKFYLGIKGGSARTTHLHLDAGSFIFELNGVRWSIDMGYQDNGALDKAGLNIYTFDQASARWPLLSKNNFGHSTITANGALFDVTGHASITDFKDGAQPEVTLDLTKPLGGMVGSLQRRFVKEVEQSILIEDRFTTNEKTEYLTWQMMTVADVTLTTHGALLTQGGQKLSLEILSPQDLQVSVVALNPPPLPVDLPVKNLKRLEIRIPAYTVKGQSGLLQVRLSGRR